MQVVKTPWRPLSDLLADLTAADQEVSTLAHVVYTSVAPYVRYDFACFAVTDPASGLVTGASKTRSLGVGDEEFAAVEYGPPDVNSFAELADRNPPVGALSMDTGGHPERCRRHRELMLPRFGFTDELRVLFPSRGVTWGGMALYRGPDEPPFDAGDVDQLAGITGLVGAALARSLFRPAPPPDPAAGVGQAVLIVDRADHVTQLTASAETAVEELGGWEHGSLPASILTLVASTRAHGEQAATLVRTTAGRWLSLRAALLSGPGGHSDTVVTIDATPRTALSRLALAAHGLTAREEDVTLLVLQGASTQSIATKLHLSPHTVQDHLKKVFGKVGVTSRRDLTARLTLG
jgi:DNA-binding CsgD family transcriptional regulator